MRPSPSRRFSDSANADSNNHVLSGPGFSSSALRSVSWSASPPWRSSCASLSAAGSAISRFTWSPWAWFVRWPS